MRPFTRPSTVYRTLCRMSKTPRVLVEGPSDKDAIQLLHRSIWRDRLGEIVVDTIDVVYDPGISGSGNRERLEALCQRLGDLGASHHHVVGLTDREYRSSRGLPRIDGHAIPYPNLVWTMGHSIENYFIDEDLSLEAFRQLAWTSVADKARRVYLTSFLEWARAVAIIGLACGRLDIRSEVGVNQISEDILEYEYKLKRVRLDYEKWIKKLVKNVKLDSARTEVVEEGLRHYGQELAGEIPESVFQLCHGHAVAKMLKALYFGSVKLAGGDDRELKRIQSLSEESLLLTLMTCWADKVKAESFPSPSPVLIILEGKAMR